ncbi:MAG TPA: AMP-binding protein [Candidatus Binataceae bacterium]|nr:AMP-binding protein [Candidatus Binataceae bacterium]
MLGRLVEAAPRYAALLRSQYWRPEQLDAWRGQHLERTLRAASRIPFYAERLRGAPRADDLSKLPILRRSDIAPLNASVRTLYPADTRFPGERSSGTSGVAVELLFDKSHQTGRNAARTRYLRANGWNPLHRSVWFVGARLLTMDNPDYREVADLIRGFASLGVKFLSTFMPFDEAVDALTRIRPVSLYGYPSGIDGILRFLEKTGRRLPSVRLIMCGGEAVDESLRRRARTIFGFDLRDNYGSTEAFLAFQCPAGSYHINAEHVILEVVDDAGREVAPGAMGRVLVTTLENYLMPLIRYEIGDYAVAAGGACSCGRTLPLLGGVLGRQVNLLRMPDGSLVSGWYAVGMLREAPEFKIFQLVQKSLTDLRVRYVSDRALAHENEVAAVAKLREQLGPQIVVTFERVDAIERSSSGKFMVTISELA